MVSRVGPWGNAVHALKGRFGVLEGGAQADRRGDRPGPRGGEERGRLVLKRRTCRIALLGEL
jgi:hypothetical protein